MRGERPPGGIVSPSRYGAIMQAKGHLRLHRRSRLYRAKQDERSGMWSVNVYRSLTLYSNEDDSLVAEHRLHNIGIDVMQGLWNRPRDDPMPAVYPVEEWMMPTLHRYMDEDIEVDTGRFSYFVETTADFPGEEIDVAS
jgi:hypothetical protein